jgi:uncharacterized DUF497 family protein
VEDLIIEILIIEEDRPEHIAKHSVTLDEVFEVIERNYVYIKGREDRWLVIGKTTKRRFLTIVIGEREEAHTFGLVTARSSRKEEKSFYIELTTQHEGGEEHDQRKAS